MWRTQINTKTKPTTETRRTTGTTELWGMGTRRRCAIYTLSDRVDIVVPGKPRLFRNDLPDMTVTFNWAEVTQVAVFKRDRFTVDCICMAFELNRKESVELNENLDGWNTLIKAVPVYLSGALTEGQWWDKVVWPTFESCFTEIYSRPASP